jgi:hypothetical protein
MKRLPLLGFATLAFGIIALAAETIRYEPALNTITKYRTTAQSTAEILSSSLTTSDGKPAPAAFENILETLKAALNTTQTLDMTEKVVAVEANGTRQLETSFIAKSLQPTPPIGYEIRSSMTPEGLLSITSFKFDTATLAQPGFAALGDSFSNSLRDAFAQAQPNIYGQPLDTGQTLKFNTNAAENLTSIFKSIPEAKIQTEGLQSTLEYTYQGRNSTNDHTFKILGSITPGKFIVDLGFINLEQTMSEIRSEGEATYFADGRIKSNQQRASQTLTQIQKIDLSGQILTLNLKTILTSVSNTEILP